MKWIRLFAFDMVALYGNIGIALGMTFAFVLLLRPVMTRFLRPRYRVGFWMVAWMMGWTWSLYNLAGNIRILPITFRGLIIPRSIDSGRVPEFISALEEPGEHILTLPGGGQVPFTLTEGFQNVAAVLIAAGFVFVIWWMAREEKRIKLLCRTLEPLSPEWHRAHGLDPDTTCVRIGRDLPTSFVCRTGVGVHDICLQKELPPEQMELVLRHELAHVRGSHVWFKGILAVLIVLYWWNPVFWVAYRLTCRDIELACDESVLKELDEAQRREYARTLVELGSGKHLWAGLTCFGESDAEIRVRRVVDWKREPYWMPMLIWPVLGLAMLFLFTSPSSDLVDREAAWQDYIRGSEVSRDVERFTDGLSDTVEEVWVRDRTLLVHTGSGQWHLMSYRWDWQDQVYRWRSHMLVEDPGMYEFTRVECWDNAGRRDDTLWSDYVSGPKLEEDLRRLMDYPVEVLAVYQEREDPVYVQRILVLLKDDYWPWWECSFDREDGVWNIYQAHKLEGEEMNTAGMMEVEVWGE